RTHLSQQMEDRWLVKRDARNPIRPGERRVQRDSTAIGMAHEVNLTGARTNQRDRAARFVSEREGVLAGPHFGALIAVVLRRLDVGWARKSSGGGPPLAGAGA